VIITLLHHHPLRSRRLGPLAPQGQLIADNGNVELLRLQAGYFRFYIHIVAVIPYIHRRKTA
jgi:hypothetical protein